MDGTCRIVPLTTSEPFVEGVTEAVTPVEYALSETGSIQAAHVEIRRAFVITSHRRSR